MQDLLFQGLRILDLTKVFSGPFCTRLFSDYGAEVIKIENPLAPDDSREFPPVVGGWSGYYEMLNRGKKGITLDLKTEIGKNHFFRLVKSADVVVENLTPQTKYSLGIDYESIRGFNPKIIYASLSGTGQAENRRYYDILAQAESGMMTISGELGHPVKIGPSVVDAFSGMTLAFGISSALYYREKTGKGQMVDVSMIGAAMHLLESNLTEASITKRNPVTKGNQDIMIAPFGIYRAKDGYVAIAAGNDRQWQLLSSFLSTKYPVDQDLFATNILRVKHNDALTSLIEKVFSTSTVQDIVDECRNRGIAASRVNTMLDVLSLGSLFQSAEIIEVGHPKLGVHVEPGYPLHFSQAVSEQHKLAPTVGEHNSEYGI